MSAENKAVFLSYASQDAEAAKRICEALRAAGVEVWFDQSELRGGDAWDAMIRKRIKECALFVPVISANTQARLEGYFRLEWKLAAQRTHAMADEKAFLLPVVIDGTREVDAKVPSEFKVVQWTRLATEESRATLAARVRMLLEGRKEAEPPRTAFRVDSSPLVRASQWRRRMLLAVLVVALGTGPAVWWWRGQSEATFPLPKADPAAELNARFAALLRNSREEVVLAESHAENETSENPQSSGAWAGRAFVQSLYLIRGWDSSAKRRQDAQAFARRALALDPANTRAMSVLATVLTHQGAFDEAGDVLRRALVLRPDSAAMKNQLAIVLSGQGKTEEAISLLEELVQSGDRSSNYNLGLLHQNKEKPDFEAALRCFEAAMTAEPPANLLIHKAALLAGARGDLAGARATLELLQPVDRLEDRAVGTAMMLGLLEHNPAQVLAAGRQTARDYFEDLYVHGPKAWRLAHAHRLQGKESLAKQEWEKAEMVLRQRLATSPGHAVDAAALAVTLAWLGRTGEAVRLMAPVEAQVAESSPRVSGFAPDHLRLLYLAYFYAGLGDASRTATYLRRVLNRRELLTTRTIPLDPWWDRVRDQPEFMALLKPGGDPAATRAVSPIPAQSVAVLAFENRSHEPDSEYFSDGVSDELINVLGRVAGLRVVARTSSFAFKGNRAASAQEIARTLGVTHLVEGSVQQVGGKARVIARLIRADTGQQLWGDSFDAEVKDILSAQESTARAIAEAMALRLNPGSRVEPLEAEAVRLYLQGRQEWGKRTVEAMRRAEGLFQRAIALEPRFARAHSGLVDTWMTLGQDDDSVGLWGEREASGMSRMLERARLAVALDPESAEAHTSLGGALVESWQPAEARHAFERALALNPNYATAHQWLGRVLLREGLADAAVASLRRACELDPLSSRMADNLGVSLWFVGRGAEGLAELDRALVLQPDSEQAMAQRAMVLATLGRREEASTAAREVLARGGPRKMHAVYALAMVGQKDEAARALASVPPARALSRRAAALAALGRWEECWAALQPATLVPATAEHVLFNPVFDPIRNDPRFVSVLKTLSLREAHERAQAWRAASPADRQRSQR